MKNSPPDQRQLGRRTSDWLMPIIMWVVAFSSVLAARHFYQRTMDLEIINVSLTEQVRLLERGQRVPIKEPDTSAPHRPK